MGLHVEGMERLRFVQIDERIVAARDDGGHVVAEALRIGLVHDSDRAMGDVGEVLAFL